MGKFSSLDGRSFRNRGMSKKESVCSEAPEENQHSANWRKWLWAGVSSLVIVLVFLVAWALVADEPVEDISDLREQYGKPLPTDARGLAWARFVESLPRVVQFEDIEPALATDEDFDAFALRPDDPLLKEYFSRNQETLERTLAVLEGKEVLKETEEAMPELPKHPLVPETGYKLHGLALLLVQYAWNEAKSGRGAEVLPLLETFTALNHCWLLRSNGGGDEWLPIIGADLAVMTALRDFSGQLMTKDACLRVACSWEKFELSGEDFKRILFHELQESREQMSRTLDKFASEKPPSWLRPFAFKPGVTANLQSKLFRELAAEKWELGKLPLTATQLSLQRELDGGVWRRYLVENYFGKTAALVLVWKAETRVQFKAMHNARNRLLRTGLALRAYWLEHGESLPPNLETLVPEYLSAVPLDPFSEKPICYDREQQRIWLVQNDEEMKLDWPPRKNGSDDSDHR